MKTTRESENEDINSQWIKEMKRKDLYAFIITMVLVAGAGVLIYVLITQNHPATAAPPEISPHSATKTSIVKTITTIPFISTIYEHMPHLIIGIVLSLITRMWNTKGQILLVVKTLLEHLKYSTAIEITLKVLSVIFEWLFRPFL